MLRAAPGHPTRDERLAHHELEAGRPEVALEPLRRAILWRKDLATIERGAAESGIFEPRAASLVDAALRRGPTLVGPLRARIEALRALSRRAVR